MLDGLKNDGLRQSEDYSKLNSLSFHKDDGVSKEGKLARKKINKVLSL